MHGLVVRSALFTISGRYYWI